MGDVLPAIGWLAFTIAAIFAGLIVVFAVRRWASHEVKTDTFTIQDLREMRARGEISEQEFQSMRAALLAELDIGLPSESLSREPPTDDSTFA